MQANLAAIECAAVLVGKDRQQHGVPQPSLRWLPVDVEEPGVRARQAVL